jgi:hypothetical protein
MTEVQIILVIAYALLSALLVLVLIYGRLHYGFKLALVVLTASLYVVSYKGWQQVQGWPTQTSFPDQFLLHASVIDEPDQEEGTKGQIFIWATRLEGSFPAGEPRAYVVPYGQELHSSLEDALRNMRNGNVQLGAKTAKEEGDKNVKFRGRVGTENDDLEFTTLPDPSLPEK